jgi:hypothetical protein
MPEFFSPLSLTGTSRPGSRRLRSPARPAMAAAAAPGASATLATADGEKVILRCVHARHRQFVTLYVYVCAVCK